MGRCGPDLLAQYGTGLCEYGNESAVYIKGGDFLTSSANFSFSKKDSAQLSCVHLREIKYTGSTEIR